VSLMVTTVFAVLPASTVLSRIVKLLVVMG